MFRLPPPRGRASTFVLLAALALSVLFVAPAGAVEAPEITLPGTVTGRSPLTITAAGVDAAVTVALRDADGETSSWRFPAGSTTLTVDLDSPDRGSAPVNGEAAVKVATAAGSLLERLVTLDRDPGTPQLTAVVRGQRVGLFWDAVAAPGAVTYRLQRATTGSDWQTIAETPSASGHTERGLAPGRYRYRLVAAVAGADGSPNLSGVTATQIRVLAPEPEPAADPQPSTGASGSDDGGTAAKGDGKNRDKPINSRDVAATGTVRGSVTPSGTSDPADAPAAKTPLIRSTADAPAVNAGMPPTQTLPAPVQRPKIAPAATPTPLAYDADVPTLDYFPVIVPPAGALAVEAAGAPDGAVADAVTLLAGVAFLGLAAGGFRRRRRPAAG